MHFDEADQRAAVARVAWATGGAGALLWFAVASFITLAAGRSPWPDLAWTGLSAILMGRLVTAVASHRLRRDCRPVELDVGLAEPQLFGRRLRRRARLWGYKHVEAGVRTGMGFLPPRRLRRVMPPLIVNWRGGGARLEGPRFLVRLAARLAVP